MMAFRSLLFGMALLVTGLAQAQTPSGEQIYKQRCQMCHVVKAGAPSMLGPNLAGVVGRPAGTAKFNYSPAMKATKITWTKDTLNTYLAGPGKMVPGTRMVVNVSDATQRKAVIGYLATIK
jgi:cytochrome c